MIPQPWVATLLVASGSALGGVGRFWLSTRLGEMSNAGRAWPTVVVNVLGSAAIGAVMARLMARGDQARALEQFLVVGVLGGFTTFSAFSFQTFELLREGAWPGAAVNVAASVFLCLAATAASFHLAR